jgi:hypothetical protein
MGEGREIREGGGGTRESRVISCGKFPGRERPFPTFPSFPTFPTMKPPTDYIRHAARLARKLQMDASLGGTPQPDAEFFKALSKAFDEIAAGLEQVGKPD